MKLSQAVEQLVIATRADGRSPRTVQSYREKLSYLVAYLEDAPIETVTTHDLRRYVADLWDQDLSPFTVKSRVRALKRLFNWLQAEGELEGNPSERIKTPNPKRKEPKGVSWDDFRRLLTTTEGSDLLDLRDRAAIMFLYDTGCRVGGLVGLQVDDLDLERRRATVTEKGGETRQVFYQEPTAEALQTWLEARPEWGPWVFLSWRGDGRPLTQSGVYRMLKRRGEEGGCTGPINPHAFRHGFARAYLLAGGDLGTLSDILGHSDVAVTKDFYGVFTVGELQRQHDRFSPLSRLEGGEDGER